MIYYSVKTGQFYTSTIKYILGVASPSFGAFCNRPKIDCIWLSTKAFFNEQREINKLIHDKCKNRYEAFSIINELGGYER